ncbi:carbamoyl transferase [Candidatus Kaiserbacteria bacterium]|nr:carbamoyl transferase [Candidatus Kaiserbacteria bacterium]
MDRHRYILGLNFAYHELSACIIKNGRLLAAIEEERFSRIKRGKKALVSNPDVLPRESIRFCLKTAGIELKDVDHIGLSFLPEDRLKNINADKYFVEGDWGSEKGEKLFYTKIRKVPTLLNRLARENMNGKIVWVPHHVAHAASAFLVSPFREAAVLSMDGIGEFTSTWMGHGVDTNLQRLKEIGYPHSIGFLWEKISKYLGFTEYDSSKVMGLAAYGDTNRFYPAFQRIVSLRPNGEFIVDNEILRVRVDDFSQLEKLFGVLRITSPSLIRRDQEDIAAALQKVTDDVVLHVARFLRQKTKSENLCLAGGVALNCVSNGLLARSGLFKRLYIQPAANDAGTALGAAYYIWNSVLGKKRNFVLRHPYWGPRFSDADIRRALKRARVTNYKKMKDITKEVASRLAEGHIIGWFQGRVEWGPRALGNRSLLADPRWPDMKMILNERIKRREPFRPFAPSVLAEKARTWFSISKKSRSLSSEFMIINFDVKANKKNRIPAVTHVDGTARAQLVDRKTNSLYHKLISRFYKLTGVPIVLNTSFNDNEPIVCTPGDAIRTFQHTEIDYLALGDYLVGKKTGKLT